MPISEKEFAVIREISKSNGPTQRSIAEKVGISLGLTNLIVKRLAKKGYIKIQEVPPRTVVYMLTPKGLMEKARKSYHFTMNTINSIKTIKENIQAVIIEEHRQGARKFVIGGNGELAALTEIAFRDLGLDDIDYSRADDKSCKNRLLCDLIVNSGNREKKIDVLSKLSQRGVY